MSIYLFLITDAKVLATCAVILHRKWWFSKFQEKTHFFLYSKLLFFDTETVAISPKYIISIAYILYENGKRKDYGYVICNPDYPISPGASRVNGFTNENVANKPLFNEI